jgi:RNA polymerase sigma factor for flagellar operon FliA
MSAVTAYSDSGINMDQLVTEHAPLINRIAYHLICRLPPSVQVEDLQQAGIIGLLEAARNYDPSLGASFHTYAGIRVRGAMLDELRKTDWVPRSVHRKTRQLTKAIQEIERREGRPARDVEIAAEMQIAIDEYYKLLREVSVSRIVSMDEVFGPGEEYDETSEGPCNELERNNFKAALAETIDHLPKKERLVMALYYDEELNLREIGEVLGVTESRVCQIHGQALIRLRARMKKWMIDEGNEKT